MGVRMSWLILDRKVVFAWLALLRLHQSILQCLGLFTLFSDLLRNVLADI